MDAEHRHELKENDLAHFMSKVGPWWKKHGLTTMIIVLAILVAVIIFRTSKQRTIAKHDETWSELGTQDKPNDFREMALKFEDPTARALAYLSGAAALNARATLPDIEESGAAQTAGDGTRDKLLEQAANMVKKLLQADDAPVLIQLNAMLLAAAIEENRGKFKDAAKYYQDLLDHPDVNGEPAIEKRARFRLEFLPVLQKQQPFGPEPTAAATDVNEATSAAPVPVDAPTDPDAAGP